MNVKGLEYILIETTDLSKWEDYGLNVCGFMKNETASNAEQIAFKIDEAPFRFLVTKGNSERYLAGGFLLEDESALVAAHQELNNHGIECVELEENHKAVRKIKAGFTFQDPAGNTLEFFYGREQDTSSFTSPQNISGFVSQGLGFGHVVFATLNIEETHNFYTEVLGFGDSDIMDLQMSPNPEDPPIRLYFMHCDNPRHHTVAFMQAPTPPSGLIHTMVEVQKVDEVGHALDRALKKDIHISSTMGRHVNDGMLSFYMQTPSGFDLEYGCEGIQPNWESFETTHSSLPSHWGHKFTPPPAE
jgi:3,4-dihydroxy-9,10-secoandrosta-1,3,5(10)-triene-9,17-dione 4,5-dioxygenase